MRNLGVGSWIARRANMTPERVALTCEGVETTYAELHARINRLARALAALGLRKGDRVAYLGLNHPAAIETLFAAGTLGAIYVALNVRFSSTDLCHAINNAGCRALVFGAEQAEVVATIRGQIEVTRYIAVGAVPQDLAAHDYDELVAAQPAADIDEAVSLDDLGLISYTSGTSTGVPKGVTQSHGSITWQVMNVLSSWDFQSDEVHIFFAPLRSLAATLLPTFYKGGKVVLMRRFDPNEVLDAIAHHRVNSFLAGPEIFQMLMDAQRRRKVDISSLRLCIGAGSVFGKSLIESCLAGGFPLLQIYGLTEASLVLSLDKRDILRKVGSVGLPPFYTEVRVVDRNMREVERGQIGEIVVRGPNVMAGYWSLPEATAQTITPDGWLLTGDAAWRDEDGFFYTVGRMKDALRLGGEIVFPAEIESMLKQHPAVADCAVLGLARGEGHEVAACVVLAADASSTAAELIAFGNERLPEHKRPRQIRIVSDIPRNANEKIVRAKLTHHFES